MDKLILQSETDIVAAIHSSTGLSAPIPFERNTLLIDTWIAETNYVENMDAVYASLKEEDPVFLIREPDKSNDEFAIRVETDRNIEIGYIPRIYSPILARLMDTGKLLYAAITKKEMIDDFYKIVISVYLKE